MDLFILGIFIGGNIGVILMALFTLNTIDGRIKELQKEEDGKITQLCPESIIKKGGKRKWVNKIE